MGWWELEENRLLVGDGPLDLTEELLERIKGEYVREQGRKPKLNELLSCLALILRYRAEEFVADAEELFVTGVVAKTKKRPRKPQLRPGDVFSISLGNGDFAFGRLTPQDSLVDFFEIRSHAPKRASQLKGAKTFRFPALIMLDPIFEGRWKVVDHLPYEEKNFRVQAFRIGGQVECGSEVRNGFIDPSSRLRPATREEMASVPEHVLWNAEMVEKNLRERLT